MLIYILGVIVSGLLWYFLERFSTSSHDGNTFGLWLVLVIFSWLGVLLAVVALVIESIEYLHHKLPEDFWDNLSQRFFTFGQKKDN